MLKTCKISQKTINLQYTNRTAPMSNKRFISILSDYGFKVTFGNTTSTLFLRTSIQALIKSEVPIASVEFDRSEITGLTKTNRGGVFDLSCIDDNGGYQFIVGQFIVHSCYNRLIFRAFIIY